MRPTDEAFSDTNEAGFLFADVLQTIDAIGRLLGLVQQIRSTVNR